MDIMNINTFNIRADFSSLQVFGNQHGIIICKDSPIPNLNSNKLGEGSNGAVYLREVKQTKFKLAVKEVMNPYFLNYCVRLINRDIWCTI